MSNGIDPRVICCATGACCDSGSPKQEAALASVIEADMTPVHDDERQAVRSFYAREAARAVLAHFTIADKLGRKTKAEFGVTEDSEDSVATEPAADV